MLTATFAARMAVSVLPGMLAYLESWTRPRQPATGLRARMRQEDKSAAACRVQG